MGQGGRGSTLGLVGLGFITTLLLAGWAVAQDPANESRTAILNEFTAVARALEEGNNAYFGRAQRERLQGKLDAPGLSAAQTIKIHLLLAYHGVRLGDLPAAHDHIATAFAAARAQADFPDDRWPSLYRLRALINLRQAELNNCVERHNAECCLVPLARGGIHTVKAPARQARADYLEYLRRRPEDLAVRWLLNLAVMALGEYPAGVPQRYLIPPRAFISERSFTRFVDVAPQLGIDTNNLCGGVVVEDFDGDGWLDIVTSTFDPRGHMVCYRNRGNGRFEDHSIAAGFTDQLGGLNVVSADFDNDGDVDVLVLRGAWLGHDGQIRNSLLQNDGHGHFTDVTARAGLARPAYPTQTAAWGDFDGDGDLDVYIGNESKREGPVFPNQLFRNNGDATFTDIAPSSGVTNGRMCKAVAAGDYDNDGDLDIYVSNLGTNRLYRNDGAIFTDVAELVGVGEPRGRSFASWFFDYDNDGWLDLFVVAYDATMSDVAADYLGLPHPATAPRLYRNVGGRFEDVATRLGLDHAFLPMGANFGDVDNDGWLDVYLATGDPDFRSLMPNVMLRNAAGTKFENITTSAGLGHLQKGHGVAFADFDHDGDLDIYHQLGGFYPGDQFKNALFVNLADGGHFIDVTLVGRSSNRHGVGARVQVTMSTPRGERTVHRAVGCVSSFGGSPLVEHIGLGDAHSIERLEVWWPTSNTRQIVRHVPMDVAVRVTEGQPGIEQLQRTATSLVHP